MQVCGAKRVEEKTLVGALQGAFQPVGGTQRVNPAIRTSLRGRDGHDIKDLDDHNSHQLYSMAPGIDFAFRSF